MTDRFLIARRGKLLFILLGVIGIIFVLRAAEIQILRHSQFRAYADSQQQSSMPLKARRGTIYDREGRKIAYDVEVKSYSVNPRYMKDKRGAARELSRITGKTQNYWLEQFRKYPGFLYAARRVSKNMESRFEKSCIETLKPRLETLRMYTYDELAAEVIGRTDIDNKGVSGLEKYYEKILYGVDGQSIFLRDARGNEVTAWEHTLAAPLDGSDIYLTLDLDLQQIVESELRRMLDSSGAIWGSAIFLDVEDGGVLACATIEKGKRDFIRNRTVVDMNEPGSTAKIVPLATVFQAGIFEPDDMINVEGGRFSIGKRTIRDDHPYDFLRCDEVGIYSSNIGVAKMGLAAGSDLIYKTLVQLGFGSKTGIDFPGETAGSISRPESWSDHLLANICYGYGMAVTGIQLASAYSAVVSGGELHKPFFGASAVSPDGKKEILNSKTVVRKALDQKTSDILRDILLGVVEMGTARKAKSDLCPIAGKTGTALRTRKEGKGYDRKRALASFAGYFPADNPRVVGVVMFDEPQTSIYGGEISAPVFGRIATRYIGIPRINLMAGMDKEDPAIESKPADGKQEKNQGAEFVTLGAQGDDQAAGLEVSSADYLPDFRGKTVREALYMVRALGLEYELTGSGIIDSQKPSPGVSLHKVGVLELNGIIR